MDCVSFGGWRAAFGTLPRAFDCLMGTRPARRINFSSWLDGCDEIFNRLNSKGALMKFYDCATASSPRRVRIFLAEKGLTVPTVQVDLRNGEQFTPAFRAGCPQPSDP